jgi:hypothetical protein
MVNFFIGWWNTRPSPAPSADRSVSSAVLVPLHYAADLTGALFRVLEDLWFELNGISSDFIWFHHFQLQQVPPWARSFMTCFRANLQMWGSLDVMENKSSNGVIS